MVENSIIFESEDCWEDCATFVFKDDGGLIISVSQEQAVDTRNEMFECTINLSKEQTIELKTWLNVKC